MEEKTNQVIELLEKNRVVLNAIEQTMGKLPRSRYSALALTSLEKGRMYLGEILNLGKEYPYEKTKEATTPEQIQKAIDLAKNGYEISDNEIIAINDLRGRLDTEIEDVLSTVFTGEGLGSIKSGLSRDKFIRDCNVSEAYRSLKEARMWLGKRLGEIRDNAVSRG